MSLDEKQILQESNRRFGVLTIKCFKKCKKFGSTVSKTVLNCNFSCVGDSSCHLSHRLKVFTMNENECV